METTTSPRIPGPTVTADSMVRTVEFTLPDQEPTWCDAENALVLPLRGKATFYAQTAGGHPDERNSDVDIIIYAAPLKANGQPHVTRHPIIMVNETFEKSILFQLI